MGLNNYEIWKNCAYMELSCMNQNDLFCREFEKDSYSYSSFQHENYSAIEPLKLYIDRDDPDELSAIQQLDIKNYLHVIANCNIY